MRKLVSIILVTILLIITVIIGYKEENILIKKSEKKSISFYNEIVYDINIKKTNEQNQPLSDAVFKVKDMNGKFEQIIPEYEKIGIYYLNGSIKYAPSKIIDILPEKEQLEKIKTIEDAEKADNNGMDIYFGEDWCNVYISTPIILEEVKAPSGYIKEKYILVLNMQLTYSIENENLLFDYYVGYLNSTLFMEYNEMIDFTNFTEKLYNRYYKDILKATCTDSRRIDFRTDEDRTIQLSDRDPTGDPCALNIINKKGTIDLKIQNFVNEKSNVITTANKTLKYQIKVENKGTASSTENTIVTEIPKGLSYVENSASHDGEYNKNDHEIMWRIDEINAEETVELTYEATVPKDADPKMQYIGKTSINSKEVSEDIKSEETVVTIMDNPKTSNFVNFIILILSGILVSGTYFTTIKKNKLK